MAEHHLVLCWADLSAFDLQVADVQERFVALAEALAGPEPDAVALIGAPTTAVPRAALGYLVRKRNRLLRLACASEAGDGGMGRYLAVLHRRTTAVAQTARDEGGGAASLAVAVVEPPVRIVAARRFDQPGDGQGGPLLVSGEGVGGLPELAAGLWGRGANLGTVDERLAGDVVVRSARIAIES